MIISPLSILRSLPSSAKHSIKESAVRILRNDSFEGYIVKALQIEDLNKNQELDAVNILLSQEKKHKHPYVLSYLHELKKSGKYTFISYQDKRGTRPIYFQKKRTLKLRLF